MKQLIVKYPQLCRGLIGAWCCELDVLGSEAVSKDISNYSTWTPENYIAEPFPFGGGITAGCPVGTSLPDRGADKKHTYTF